MRNTYYTYLLLGSTILSGTMLNLGVAQAACMSTPDCDSLGYTETSCPNGELRCPWNPSKLFCACTGYDYTCTGSNETGGSGDSCGGKYTACTCASGYSWSGGVCCENIYQYDCTGEGYSGAFGNSCGGKYASCTCAGLYFWNGSRCAQVCSVGEILYSDMSCSTDLVSGRTPIGVVSYINGSKRIAIQLDAPSSGMMLSSDYTNIGDIPNYTDYSTALNDFNGKSNTQIWVNYYGSDSGYAPGYCNSYSKAGVGGWYLPAAGELYASVYTNESFVDAGLSAAGGTGISGGGYYWSSSENNSNYAWVVLSHYGTVSYKLKDDDHDVRCVLAF